MEKVINCEIEVVDSEHTNRWREILHSTGQCWLRLQRRQIATISSGRQTELFRFFPFEFQREPAKHWVYECLHSDKHK